MKVTPPDDFMTKLSGMGAKTDEIIGKVLKAGAEATVPKVRSNLQTVIRTDRSTGELASSIGISPASVDNKGRNNVKIGFNEPRRNQYDAKGKRSYGTITNAMIANVIEHGKAGQPARPFFKPAVSATKAARDTAMATTLEEEIKKL